MSLGASFKSFCIAFTVLCSVLGVTANGLQAQPNVRQVYYQLPMERLPILHGYSNEADDEEFRDRLLVKVDLKKGYLKLQGQGQNAPMKCQIKEFKNNKGSLRLILVESTRCRGSRCSQNFDIFMKEGGQWIVENSFFPQLSAKSIRKRLKKEYEEFFGDDSFYEESGYEEDERLLASLVWEYIPQDDVIIIREQNIPINLFSVKWNSSKGGFDIKEIK